MLVQSILAFSSVFAVFAVFAAGIAGCPAGISVAAGAAWPAGIAAAGAAWPAGVEVAKAAVANKATIVEAMIFIEFSLFCIEVHSSKFL